MADAKYTPGPWSKSERLNGPWWHIYATHTVGGQPCKSGLQAIACVHGESKRGAKAYAEMFEANARLIAAAPELLDALMRIAQYIEPTAVDAGAMQVIARAAIAKATGSAS